MKSFPFVIFISLFISCYTNKNASLCENELSYFTNTDNISYIKLDTSIHHINESVSNALDIDSICGYEYSLGIPFDWEAGKIIEKGGIPIEIYFENRCSTVPIEMKKNNGKLILINHKGELLFEGTECNTNNIIHQLDNIHYWGVKENHYRIKTDLVLGNYPPIDTVSLVIKKLIESHLLKNQYLSKNYLKKEFCDLNKNEFQQIEKENPLTISFVLNVSTPPPHLELDTIYHESDNEKITPTTQY